VTRRTRLRESTVFRDSDRREDRQDFGLQLGGVRKFNAVRLQYKDSQLGAVHRKLGVVRKFNVVQTCKPAFESRSAVNHAEFVHMQRISLRTLESYTWRQAEEHRAQLYTWAPLIGQALIDTVGRKPTCEGIQFLF
jgi:hypothetical protein